MFRFAGEFETGQHCILYFEFLHMPGPELELVDSSILCNKPHKPVLLLILLGNRFSPLKDDASTSTLGICSPFSASRTSPTSPKSCIIS